MRRAAAVACTAVVIACLAPAASQAISGWPAVPISSTAGSGSFGTWRVDRFGLPSYAYRIDEQRNPIARQPELAGSTDAWHQLGNDHIVADAFNHGYVQLWSQDRRYEWTNRYDPAAQHFAGGYGYLRVGNRVISTLYDDRPAGSDSARDFGVGYFRHTTSAARLAIDEYVYAPFGNDPVLLHDVTVHNGSSRSRKVTWFEYWDVNPFDQATKAPIATGPVRSMAGLGALATTQTPTTLDPRPLTIFAAALNRRPQGTFGDTRSFFGSGADARAEPAAATDNRAGGRLASAGSGRAMFAFRPDGHRPGALVDHAPLRLRRRARANDRDPCREVSRCGIAAAQQRAALARVGAPDRVRSRPQVAIARAAVGRVHGQVRRDLRAVPRTAHHLPGRLLPVRLRVPGSVPRSAPAHAADDLHRPVAGARRPALLGAGAAAGRWPDPLRDVRAVPQIQLRRLRRPRPVAAVGGGRIRPRHEGSAVRSIRAFHMRPGGPGRSGTHEARVRATRSRCMARTAAIVALDTATGRTYRRRSCT